MTMTLILLTKVNAFFSSTWHLFRKGLEGSSSLTTLIFVSFPQNNSNYT